MITCFELSIAIRFKTLEFVLKEFEKNNIYIQYI